MSLDARVRPNSTSKLTMHGVPNYDAPAEVEALNVRRRRSLETAPLPLRGYPVSPVTRIPGKGDSPQSLLSPTRPLPALQFSRRDSEPHHDFIRQRDARLSPILEQSHRQVAEFSVQSHSDTQIQSLIREVLPLSTTNMVSRAPRISLTRRWQRSSLTATPLDHSQRVASIHGW